MCPDHLRHQASALDQTPAVPHPLWGGWMQVLFKKGRSDNINGAFQNPKSVSLCTPMLGCI